MYLICLSVILFVKDFEQIRLHISIDIVST